MKIGRNDPCPCGSGRKYKHCCLGKPGARTSPADFARDDPPRFGGSRGSDETVLSTREQAMDIMRSQTGFSDSAELETAMREYERHCESLPPGAAPRTFMAYLGRPNAATENQKALTAAAAGKHFDSRGEIEDFVRTHVDGNNLTPVGDFEGLSPSQMHQILTKDIDANRDLVELADDLPAAVVLSAEIADVMRWVLSYFADKGGEVKLTSRGNYNRALCRAYCEKYLTWFGENRSVPIETSLTVLIAAHDFLVALGYADEVGSRAWITTDGVDIYSRSRWARMYCEAFRYSIDTYDWLEWLPYEYSADYFDFVRNAALFFLFLLQKFPEGTVGEFMDRISRAFPEFFQPAQGDPQLMDLIASIASELFFMHFCIFFGLIEYSGDPSDFPGARDAEYRVTPLFSRLFIWKFISP